MDAKQLWARLRGDRRNGVPVPHMRLACAGIEFIGPQEGQIEEQLKADWVSAFRAEPTVARAYLAIASHFITDGAPVVVLCIRFKDDKVHENVVFGAMSIFRSKGFHKSQMLDLLPISGVQEEALAAVCAPFYHSAS